MEVEYVFRLVRKMKMITTILLIVCGMFLLGSMVYFSGNKPMLEGGFKEIRTFVYGGERQSELEQMSIQSSSQNTITISPIRTEYIDKYKIRCTGNESVLCPYIDYKIIYNTTIINKTLNITKKVWNKTIFNISSPKEKFNLTNKSQYTLPTSYPLKKDYNSTLVYVPKELKKANPLSLTPDKFEAGDRIEYIFELEANVRYAKLGLNSIEIIQSKNVVGDSLFSNVTPESGDANFTHLSISDTAPYDNLVGYWNFDGDNVNSPKNTSYDFTKENNDGTMANDAFVNDTNCVIGGGGCLHVDGIGDHVNVGDMSEVEGVSDFSISIWTKVPVIPGNTLHLLSKFGEGDDRVFYLHARSSNNIFFGVFNSSNDEGLAWHNTGLVVDVWKHIVGVYNGTHVSVYVDGVVGGTVASLGGVTDTSIMPMIIGAENTGGGGGWNGSIDEVMVFNTSLTQAQITAIYNNQSARFVKEGTQKVRAVKVTNGSTWDNGGFNRVNLTVDYQANMKSNISARIGQINLSVNNSGLVLYMPFEWGSAVDISGEGNDGTLVDDTFFNETGGLNDTGGFEFDGNGDYINVGTGIVEGLSELTISAWVKNNLASSSQSLTAIEQLGTGDDVFNLIWRGSADQKFSFVLYNDSQDNKGAISPLVVTDQEWHHIVGTYNGSHVQVYVDGGNKDLTPPLLGGVTETAAGMDLNIAGDSVGLNEWNGSIDEVMIFNRTLTATEISTLYTQSASRYHEAYYTDYQNITGEDNFTINPEADFVFPDFKLWAGNQSHPFYTPILNGSITLETWNFTGIVADTSPPTYSGFTDNASSDTTNSTDVQLNVTISDVTAIDFYRIATNNTDGNSLTNGTLIDAGDATSLLAIFNESIAWFPTTGGTFGWQVWANDTGGFASVSAMQTLTVQSTCTIPVEDLSITEDTTFCAGTYLLNDTNTNGAIIMNCDSCTLNCSGASLVGNLTANSIGINISKNTNDVLIKNCIISNYRNGISTMSDTSSGNIIIQDNNFSNIINDAINFDNPENSTIIGNRFVNISHYTIRAHSTTNVTISNNWINGSDNVFALIIVDGRNNTVKNNTLYIFDDSDVAIRLDADATFGLFGNMINYNTIIGNGSGIGLDIDPIGKENFIINNTWINLETGVQNIENNSILQGNTFNDSSVCIFLGASDFRNTVINNTFNNCSSAIRVFSAQHNNISKNTFNNNRNRAFQFFSVFSNNNTFSENIIDSGLAFNYYGGNDTFLNNIYSDGIATYVMNQNPTNISINETSTSLHNITLQNNGLIKFNYNGRKDFRVENNTITINNMISPNNDIYNQTAGKLIASDQSNYTVTISPNVEIRVGDYSPPKISFTAPTRTSGTTTGNTSIEINVTINESSLNEVVFDWNGTNTSIFNDSLVLMFNFDNVSAIGEDNTKVVDVSGNGNNGTVSGAVMNLSGGRYYGGYKFDGKVANNNHINISNNNALYGFSEMTLSVWVKLDRFIANVRIVHQNGAYNIFMDDGNKFAFGTYQGGFDRVTTTAISLDRWYHVVGVFNGSQRQIYIDGVFNASEPETDGDIPSSSDDLFIGRDETVALILNGTIDEVRIYNRSLSSDEVQQLYFTNLRKYDTDLWNLYVNQSLNSTDGLVDGTYTYQAHASDSNLNWNSTEERTITISTAAVTCDCPISGNWNINDGSICKPTADCNIGTNKLRIPNGGLRIDSGINVRTSGCWVKGGEILSVDKDGGLYCES